MIEQQEQIIKKIHTEQEFSDLVFKNFRAERFGITYDCPIDLDKISIKKELCDWEDLKTPVYTEPSITETLWLFVPSQPLPSWATQCAPLEGDACGDEGYQCFYFTVKDQNGNPIKDYPIYIDGQTIGVYDANGEFRYTMTNANVINEHTLNLCYCFTSTGHCNQTKFDIVLNTDCPAVECVIPTYLCDPVIPEDGTDCTSGCTLPVDSVYVKFGVTHDFVNCGQVMYNISKDIGGFQFTVDGGTGCGAALDGDADIPGYTVINGGCTYLGTSFIGTSIPAGCGTLTFFLIDAVPVPTGVSGVAFAEPDGTIIPVTVITDCL